MSQSGSALAQAIRELENNNTSSIKSKQTKEEQTACIPKFKPRPSDNSETSSNWGTKILCNQKALLFIPLANISCLVLYKHWCRISYQLYLLWGQLSLPCWFRRLTSLFLNSLLHLTLDTLVNWLYLENESCAQCFCVNKSCKVASAM